MEKIFVAVSVASTVAAVTSAAAAVVLVGNVIVDGCLSPGPKKLGCNYFSCCQSFRMIIVFVLEMLLLLLLFRLMLVFFVQRSCLLPFSFLSFLSCGIMPTLHFPPQIFDTKQVDRRGMRCARRTESLISPLSANG